MSTTDTAPAEATTALVDTYFAMWREPDAAARRSLVEQAFIAEGRHVDPHADARGHDEVDAMIAGVHAAYPGFAIERTSGIDQHGDQLRYAWRLDLADGSTLVAGIDVAELAPDGRLARVAGFWGDLV
jgi:SnoaL-like domain